MLISLYIINKAGGLIFQRDYAEGVSKLSSNEYLVLAGTFHGIHALASKISPIPGSSGIELLETQNAKICCFQTLSGVKFLLIADSSQGAMDSAMRKVYEVYSVNACKDYVMKNPFYTPEMPIRIELFDMNMLKLFKQFNGI